MRPRTWADAGIDTQGRSSGSIRVSCPQCSPHRRKKREACMAVDLDKQVWHCHHCGWSGGLATGPVVAPQLARSFRKPDYVGQASALPAAVVEWFAGRGITPAVLKRNQVGSGQMWFPQVEADRSCVMFPYLRGSEVVNVKYRTPDKMFRMEKGAERVLYGLNDVGETLVWVEGEIDKLSVEVAGIASCVSVPDGAPAANAKNYESKFDFMDAPEIDRAKRHVIAVDADEPGQRLRDELVRRLGPDRCLIATWPDGCKDANDTLREWGAQVVRLTIEAAQPVPVDGAHDVMEFEAALREAYANPMNVRGLSTGWSSIDAHYTVLAGEWTLVTGIPGHGKSEWLDALLVNLAQLHGWTFALFSPENNPPTYHLQKLAEKYVGKPFGCGPTERMTPADLDRATTWLHEHFTLLMPPEGQRTIDALLDRARQLVQRKGIRGLVLDPWNEMEHERARELTETEYISRTLSKVRSFAKAHEVHVWIVAHPKQLVKDRDGKYPVPTPYDVSGSAHWRNKADNCITIQRDLLDDKALVDVHIQKVRKKSVGKPGLVSLRYSPVCGQYADREVLRDPGGREYSYSFGQAAA